MSQKIIELARKLKALKDRGVGGEKTTAAAALERLMKKHDIDPSLLDDQHKTERSIEFNKSVPFATELAVQIVFRVIGDDDDDRQVYHRPKKRRHGIVTCKLSDSEYIEVLMNIEHYINDFHKQVDSFFHAYLDRNNLLGKRKEGVEYPELTKEEEERLKRARAMRWSISPSTPSKRLKQ